MLRGGDVLVATHAGPFADLDRTYAVLGAAANELGIATDGAIRELYVVGPDVTDDPMRLRTEVCWPIAVGDCAAPRAANSMLTGAVATVSAVTAAGFDVDAMVDDLARLVNVESPSTTSSP